MKGCEFINRGGIDGDSKNIVAQVNSPHLANA